MSDDIPDIDDADIREMVKGNHWPYEAWSMAGRLIGPVICHGCHNVWPCPTIKALRDWKRRNRESYWER